MELQTVKPQEKYQENINSHTPDTIPGTRKDNEIPSNRTSFIKANTVEADLSHLRNDCIVPVFSKDNEQTIAHQEFIEVTLEAFQKVFPNQQIECPEIRVSHQVKGRTPDALHIPAKELQNHQRTIYYERMAFLSLIPGITQTIDGNNIALCIGGVRAYNQENLYSKKSLEKFKFFIGFQNMVCCNLCISSDGFAGELKAASYQELERMIEQSVADYDYEEQYREMKDFKDYFLTEKQFAQLLGKVRLYNYLPKKDKIALPDLILNENHFSTVAQDYYKDESFCRNDNGEINIWKLYNLLTGANKSSYIDTFLDRNENAYDFAKGVSKAINGDSAYDWFLS
ncbi:DUF3871 family protein [Zunongwangia sp. H14]|uniref:DUF3871 family protein n=1 Tax=Zunongwangia sp. H14 TaxID=3240792 RepID=UPI00356B318F